jgi:cell division FtsZ-interacting protein ZapD
MQTSFPVGCWINPTNPLQQAQFIGLRVFKKSNTYDSNTKLNPGKMGNTIAIFSYPKNVHHPS